MTPGNRLRWQLSALLLVAVAAAPIALAPGLPRPGRPAHDAATTGAPAVAAGLAAGRAGDAGASEARPDRGAVLDQLARGYPDEGPAAGAVTLAASLTILVLLGLCALAIAAAIGQLVSRDLAALASRLEASGAGAQPPSLEGLALAETVRLGHAIRVALPETPWVEAAGGAPGDAPAEGRHRPSQLVANIGRELRGPLNSILGFAELVLRGDDGQLDDATHRHLAELRRIGKRLNGFINHVHETARYEAGHLSLELHPTAVEDLLRGAIEELPRLIEQPADVEVQPSCERDIARIEVDPVRMVQALALLLGETVSRSEPGVVRIAAGERGIGEARTLAIEIEAPGVLHAGDDKARAASPRPPPPGNPGLAVAIARSLIEPHGAALAVEEGPPARFLVTFGGPWSRHRSSSRF